MSASGADQPLRPVPRHRYVDFQVAGEGAMGLVYLALDTELNRNVAFKIVRPDAGTAQADLPPTPLEASAPPRDARFGELSARFLEEACVTGGMEHPGIVPVYELGRTDGGVPYYTMRFVRGQRTLETEIEELRERSFEERLAALEPFLKLCDAVSYAHAKGVIHRDLKPANVALGEFGEVVLLDWGLARQVEQAPAAAEADEDRPDAVGGGTLGYMGPEALRGGLGALDARSDVYSLGVILFQVLTGRLPFPTDPVPEYLKAVLEQEAPSARSVSEAVPEALDELCAQALRRHGEDRLPSVRALSEGVRHWQTQSALDREVERLLRDATSALAAAEDSKGPSRIRQTQRALTVLDSARERRPDSDRLRKLRTRARDLRNLGIKETQRSGRQRLLLVGGVSLLALLSIASFIVAGVINERRREVEAANGKAQAALAEAERQKAEAERQKAAAEIATVRAQDERDKVSNAQALTSAFASEMQPETIQKALAQDPQVCFTWIEQAREGGPLARLSVGAASRGHALPRGLLDVADRARRRVGAAERALAAARDFTEQQRATTRLVEAQQEHARALLDILSARARSPTVVLPPPPTIAQVRATLGAEEAFVSYGRVKDVAFVVVVRKTTSHAISLGKAAPIDAAFAAFREAVEDELPTSAALRVLRLKTVAPLRSVLPRQGHVFVVPWGTTALIPFPLLLPEHVVHTVPSARAYLHLRGLAPARGVGILAIADAVAHGIPRMPGARAEAQAIGTATLLGADATREKLAALLAGRPLWRAIHLGLAGRIPSDRSHAVRLVTAPGATGDTYLSTLEIALLDGRAELAVLAVASGGESMSLPQALLYAGARRVLFHTMRTDEESTRALMVKFYELWNPRDDTAGVDAATALERAQAFVRAHEQWKHPYYWASWVLWGLPAKAR